MSVIRVALPGYDAKTDTDPDHFSLYTDEDNILIKEKARGAFTRASGVEVIPHNLGYVPDFKAFVNDQASPFLRHGWKAIGAQNNAFIINNFTAYADTTNLYIANNSGINCEFTYYIFYDNQVGSSSNTIDLSSNVFVVGKAGVDVSVSLDPNDYIFHSDLNTFKILKEGNVSVTYTGDGNYSFNHGLAIDHETSFDVFFKFPDGYTVKVAGENMVFSRDQNFSVQDVIITNTEIKFTLTRTGGSGTSIHLKYYIYETPLTSTTGIEIIPEDHLLRIAKADIDASVALEPNDYTFLSGFNTLKYFLEGNRSINIVGDTTFKTTEVSISHGLGYVPYFTCFVDDFVAYPNSRYALAPYRNETLISVRKSEVYADSSNLYLKMFNQSSSNFTAKFYYKVYRNKLNL